MLKFPSKLYRLLQRAETSESGSSTGDTADFKLSDIISWLPCGKAFKIHDPEAFSQLVLPGEFGGMNSFRSFRRQLNLYGIKKQLQSHTLRRADPRNDSGDSSSDASSFGDSSRSTLSQKERLGKFQNPHPIDSSRHLNRRQRPRVGSRWNLDSIQSCFSLLFWF